MNNNSNGKSNSDQTPRERMAATRQYCKVCGLTYYAVKAVCPDKAEHPKRGQR